MGIEKTGLVFVALFLLTPTFFGTNSKLLLIKTSPAQTLQNGVPQDITHGMLCVALPIDTAAGGPLKYDFSGDNISSWT